jgi:hypothetical protein
MRNNRLLLALLISSIVTMGFRCGEPVAGTVCGGPYTNKNVSTLLTPQTTQTLFKVGDTLKFSSIISDTLTETNTTNKYYFTLDQFSLIVEIFKVVVPSGSTIPNLQPVFADFNPVVNDGQITFNNYGYGFKILYRRLNTTNYLAGGLECGRKGIYIIRFKNENGYQLSQLYNYTAYPCTTFMLNTVYGGPQNSSIFSSYNISSIPVLPTYVGFTGVSQNDKNYVVINVN